MSKKKKMTQTHGSSSNVVTVPLRATNNSASPTRMQFQLHFCHRDTKCDEICKVPKEHVTQRRRSEILTLHMPTMTPPTLAVGAGGNRYLIGRLQG